jgi:hypothetical protein
MGSWVVSGIFAGASVIMWPFVGLSLTPNAIWLVPVFAGLYCCHLTPVLVRYRLRSDDARGCIVAKTSG